MARCTSAIVIALVILSPCLMTMVVPCSTAGTPSQADAFLMSEWDGGGLMSLTRSLCNISAEHPSYRISGSEGADQAADLIKATFESYGLTVTEETFGLPIWNLAGAPSLRIDADGDRWTTDDSYAISSFIAESYSLPTASNGSFGELVTLPLPTAYGRRDVGRNDIDEGAWNGIDTTGKILVIGREVRWDHQWELRFIQKLTNEPPLAVIFRSSYDWMGYSEEYSQSSGGGRPLSLSGPYLWNQEIAAGSVNYSDGRALESLALNGSLALVDVRSSISDGYHRNIIADVQGPPGSQTVLVGAHYDTVMCEGYIDNTASVATMLEAARVLQAAKDEGALELRYNVRFVAFAAEELGLVGSLDYVDSHRDELSDVAAVIVTDCIGSSELSVAGPYSDNPIDLGQLISRAAETLDLNYVMEGLDGSDHTSFLYPQETAENVNGLWGTDRDLSGVSGLSNVVLFYSYPMTVYDRAGPRYGHIHTPSDSISGAEDEWIEVDDLKAQARMVALTVLYASIDGDESPMDMGWAMYILPAAIAIVAGSLMFLRVRSSRRRH